MADFAAVLRRTIDGLSKNTPEARAKIYEKARATVDAKLTASSAPAQLIERQKRLLDEAIAAVEAEFAPPPPAPPSCEDDFDDIFAGMDDPAPETQEAPEDTPEALPEEPAPAEPEQPVAAAEEPASEPVEDPAAEAAPYVAFGAPGVEHPRPPVAAQPVAQPHADAPAVAAPQEEPLWADEPAPVDAPERTFDRPEEAFDEPESLPPTSPAPAAGRRVGGAAIALVLLALVVGAAGFGGWLYREDVARAAGFQSFERLMAWDRDVAPAEEEVGADEPSADEEETQLAATPDAPPADERTPKFTQRLLPTGQEIDEGPASTPPTLGEGTSIAAATPGPADAEEGEQGVPAQVPVGQRAIFYEERTSSSQGSADGGAVVWSMVQESPGGNLPPEPAIRAEVTVPQKGLQLKMTIRRNADQSLPASHILELIFLTPDSFPGGGISNVLRIAMKSSEQDTGSPLLGIPAKIADGFFLVALSDSRADLETNNLLMRRQSWIDIPIVYTSGRRALITMEKGVPGERIFTEALEAWDRATSG